MEKNRCRWEVGRASANSHTQMFDWWVSRQTLVCRWGKKLGALNTNQTSSLLCQIKEPASTVLIVQAVALFTLTSIFASRKTLTVQQRDCDVLWFHPALQRTALGSPCRRTRPRWCRGGGEMLPYRARSNGTNHWHQTARWESNGPRWPQTTWRR